MLRKVLSLLIVVIVIFSAMLFTTNHARAAGVITYQGGLYIAGKGLTFVFKASDVNKKDVKGAKIFAGSSLYNLSCNVNKSAGKIVCVTGGRLTEFGGESGIIYLADQAFFVTIPSTSLWGAGCDPEEVLGAEVQFDDGEGGLTTTFVPGQSLDEVSQAARNEVTLNGLAGYLVRGTDVSCDTVDTVDVGGSDSGGDEEGGPE